MSAHTPTKLHEDLPALLLKAALPAAAAEHVTGAASTAAAVAALEAAEFLVEATRLLAHALPRREAVWWACMCAHHTAPAELPDADRASVAAAETWVRTQADAARRTAFEHAQQAGFATPEAWAAVGAFWGGDSISPAGQAAVPPPAHVAGAAIAGAVALASVRDFPERRAKRLRLFLASGLEIGGGGAGRIPPETA